MKFKQQRCGTLRFWRLWGSCYFQMAWRWPPVNVPADALEPNLRLQIFPRMNPISEMTYELGLYQIFSPKRIRFHICDPRKSSCCVQVLFAKHRHWFMPRCCDCFAELANWVQRHKAGTNSVGQGRTQHACLQQRGT